MPLHAGQFVWIKIGSSPFVFEDHPFTISSTAVNPDR
jgi:predicted ferric reductase